MHEVNLNQDVKTITLIVNCNSMEDAKKLYDLLEKLLINIKQEENTVVSLN